MLTDEIFRGGGDVFEFPKYFLSVVINGTSRDLAKLTLLITKRRRARRIKLESVFLSVLRGSKSSFLKISAHQAAFLLRQISLFCRV